MKVWIVLEWDRTEHLQTVEGVFSTKEKAEERAESLRGKLHPNEYEFSVKEWEVK